MDKLTAAYKYYKTVIWYASIVPYDTSKEVYKAKMIMLNEYRANKQYYDNVLILDEYIKAVA